MKAFDNLSVIRLFWFEPSDLWSSTRVVGWLYAENPEPLQALLWNFSLLLCCGVCVCRNPAKTTATHRCAAAAAAPPATRLFPSAKRRLSIPGHSLSALPPPAIFPLRCAPPPPPPVPGLRRLASAICGCTSTSSRDHRATRRVGVLRFVSRVCNDLAFEILIPLTWVSRDTI